MSRSNRIKKYLAAQFATLIILAASSPVVAVAEETSFVEADAQVTSEVQASEASNDVIKKSDETGETTEKIALDQYWDATRMSTAIPYDSMLETGLSGTSDGNVQLPEVVDREVQPSDPVAKGGSSGSVFDGTGSRIGNSGPVNGKVFFTGTDGKDYVCSGSAVNSNNKSVVATAGHCTHGGPGENFHKNWVFVPEYTIGIAPYGKFVAKHMVTTKDWAENGENSKGFNGDFGFVVVGTAKGKKLVDAVGGNGLRSGDLPEFDGVLIAYPQNRFFGSAMFRCNGKMTNENRGSYSFYFIRGCNFGGGASGGAWLEDYDGSHGYIRSVTSFGPRNSTQYLGGPIITKQVWDMFDKIADYQANN